MNKNLKEKFSILNSFGEISNVEFLDGGEPGDSGDDNAFVAIGEAEKLATAYGYQIGSMCRNEPIALAKNANYIAKWKNINSDEWPKIEGLLLSDDFRNGSVYLVEFNKEN